MWTLPITHLRHAFIQCCASFPLLRWEYLYAMAAAIKNMDSAHSSSQLKRSGLTRGLSIGIQPLPDPDIKQKHPRGHEYQTNYKSSDLPFSKKTRVFFN
jgi:hypothetical protein